MVLYAVIFILLALLFYSVSTWSERLSHSLKLWHIITFWIGLICDLIGTVFMTILANGRFLISFHTLTGIAGLLLMFFHAIWATIVLHKDSAEKISHFHKYSLFVWIAWLIPFFSGAMLGMHS